MTRSPSSVQLLTAKPHQSPRLHWLDAWRGLALLQMMAFHTAYDLFWMGWTDWRLNVTPGWTLWRQLIVFQFCLIAGIALAQRPAACGPDNRWPLGFGWRITEITIAAAAVSLVSWIGFGTRWIQFGILHFFAVALLITLAFERGRARKITKISAVYIWLVVGLLAIISGITLQHAYFNVSPRYWLGFATVKPATEDYVPIFPWIGVVWLGYGLGHSQLLKQASYAKIGMNLDPNAASSTDADSSIGAGSRIEANTLERLALMRRKLRWINWLGRHSLSVYLLHQPLILLILLLLQGFNHCCLR